MNRQSPSDAGAGRAITLVVIGLVGALALIALGGAAWINRDGSHSGAAAPSPTRHIPTPSPTPTTTTSAQSSLGADHETRDIDPGSMPLALTMPNVKTPTPIDPAYTGPDGELIVPDSGQALGFFIGSAYPGDAKGTVVIAGHKDTQDSLGIFYKLKYLRTGDKVGIETLGGDTVQYVISGRENYGKANLPKNLYSRTGSPRLALITCYGVYDRARGAYPENLVVYATPA